MVSCQNLGKDMQNFRKAQKFGIIYPFLLQNSLIKAQIDTKKPLPEGEAFCTGNLFSKESQFGQSLRTVNGKDNCH